MTWLIALAARIGVPEPLRRLAAIAAFVATVLVLLLAIRFGWSLWLADHDRDVIADDRAQANADVAGRALSAERAAGAAKEARDGAFVTEQAHIKEDADAAASSGASPLDAAFDRLR